MKLVQLGIALFFTISCGFLSHAQEYKKKEIRKIHRFLTEFERAAIAKDTLELNEFIYPFVYGNSDMRNEAINKILMNDESCTIDYCYSNKAFSIIKDSLFYKFTPMKVEIRGIFDEPIEAKKVFDQYSNYELPLFLYDDAIVILIMEKKQIRMFFWEGINNLHLN